MGLKHTKKGMTELVQQVKAAQDAGHTHLIVWNRRDGKGYKFEPVTATVPDDVILRMNTYDKDHRVWEVYDLSAGLPEQYAIVRAWRPPRNERKVEDEPE